MMNRVPDPPADCLFDQPISDQYKQAVLNYFNSVDDINVAPNPYHTALEAASHIGDPKLVKRLLEKNQNLDTTMKIDRHGNALLLASSGNCRETVRLLLEDGADPEAKRMRSGVYETPLDIAWNNGFIEVAEELFERLVKPEYQGPEVHRALCMAAESRDGARVNALLDNGADVNYQGDSYGPPLVYAVRGGNIEIVNTLLKSGAMVNVESSIYGCPLEAAVENKSDKMVNFLLENNADVNFSGTGNPLLSAAIRGDLDMAKLLINKGADVDIEVSEYGTPIFAAAIYRHENVASYLLERGANIDFAIRAGRRIGYNTTDIQRVKERLEKWNPNTTHIKSPSRRDLCLDIWKAISTWSSFVLWKDVTVLQMIHKSERQSNSKCLEDWEISVNMNSIFLLMLSLQLLAK